LIEKGKLLEREKVPNPGLAYRENNAPEGQVRDEGAKLDGRADEACILRISRGRGANIPIPIGNGGLLE
jgi:hypothetical protein